MFLNFGEELKPKDDNPSSKSGGGDSREGISRGMLPEA